MKSILNYATAKKILALCFLILLVNFTALSQNAFSTDGSGVNWRVNFLFVGGKSKIINVALLDGDTATTTRVTDFEVIPGDDPATVEGIKIPSISLNGKGKYRIVITTLNKKDNGSYETASIISGEINFEELFKNPDAQGSSSTQSGSASTNTPRRSKFGTKRAESKAKKDSDVYIAGEWGGSKGKKTAFSTEIKVAPGFDFKRWVYTPIFFNLNASTSPDADPDNLEIGTKLIYVHPFDIKPTPKWQFRLTGLDTSFGGKVESERDFDNTNLIFDAQMNFVVTPIPLGKRGTLTFDPYIGTELGKNVKSPVAAAEGDGVARLLGGTNVLIDVPFKNSSLEGIVWETSYTRRWLLSNELGYKTNDQNELVLRKFGKSPRDYFQSKVEFTIGTFLNPFISYEWGEMPPSYKKLDHRFRVGFVYKFKLVPR